MGRFLTMALVSLTTLVPRAAWPQGGSPLGPEFQVNTYTTGLQQTPSVAVASSGDFVVVWPSWLQEGASYGVFGQRYSSSGAPLGPEFRVNTYTTGSQSRPAAAASSSGDFVVVWWDVQGPSPYTRNLFGRRYSGSGTAMGPEFRINTGTSIESAPWHSVASDPSGNFVVIWTDIDGSGNGIVGQRFASSGAPMGSEFQVNSYSTGDQQYPFVSANSAGFVVIWESFGQDGSERGVFAQRYAGSGAPLGSEFRANTSVAGPQYLPDVASDDAGNFVVVWASPNGGSADVFGQRFAASGAPLGSEFRVNSFTPNRQFMPEVAVDASGNSVVTWSSLLQDGSGEGIFGQRYAASGAPVGPEFRVNTHTTYAQTFPATATDGLGNFVVVWMSQNQDGDNYGIFGQRFAQMVPVELTQFRVE